MKFQKWHLGLISIILIILAVVWVWHFRATKNNSNNIGTQNSSTSPSSLSTSNQIDLTKPLFFYSDTCPHCQKMKPIVQNLQSQGYQVQWVDVNASQNEELDNKYQITGVPTFVRPDGQKLIGEQDEQTLADFLKDYKK